MQHAVSEKEPIPGAVIAVQTFGDFLRFNPHCHILLTDGCFYGNKGMFRVAPPLEMKKLEAIFRHKVFKMLLKKGKITAEMVRMLSAWKHSGFNIFCGNRISPKDETSMENLARYIIRASFSHLGLWLFRSRPPAWARTADRPKICAATLSESTTSDSYEHPPHQHADCYADPDSWDDYIQS